MLVLLTWTGGILTATGIIAYLASGAASATALIPSLIGVLLLIAAFIGHRWPAARKHALHASLAVALLGVIGTFANVLKLGELIAGTAERPGAVIASVVTFIVLLAFLVAGIRSFIVARVLKRQEAAGS